MKVKIYKPTKNVMQSGKGNIKKWILEYEAESTRFIEPVMGWTGNTDTKRQIKLKFTSKKEAIEYAKRKELDYIIITPKKPVLKLRAYSDNFI